MISKMDVVAAPCSPPKPLAIPAVLSHSTSGGGAATTAGVAACVTPATAAVFAAGAVAVAAAAPAAPACPAAAEVTAVQKCGHNHRSNPTGEKASDPSSR